MQTLLTSVLEYGFHDSCNMALFERLVGISSFPLNNLSDPPSQLQG